MQVIECSADEMAGSFCGSSIELWAAVAGHDLRHVAARVVQGKNTVAEGICVLREGAGTRRSFSHLSAPSDAGVLVGLLRWFDDELGDEGGQLAMVEVGNPAEVLLVRELGWTRERGFPHQILWTLDDSRRYTDRIEPPLRLDPDAPLELAAEIFVSAFSRDWAWYFEEMRTEASGGHPFDRWAIALRYLAMASQTFVLFEGTRAVGMSSICVDRRSGRGEFHTGIGVVPDAQGRGYGRVLTEATLAWAARSGVREFEVRTQNVPGAANPHLNRYREAGGRPGRSYSLLRPRPGTA